MIKGSSREIARVEGREVEVEVEEEEDEEEEKEEEKEEKEEVGWLKKGGLLLLL